LEQLFINFGLITNINSKLPILEDFNENIINNSIKLDALTTKNTQLSKSVQNNNKDNDGMRKMINGLTNELNVEQSKPLPHDEFTSAEIARITGQIEDLRKKIVDVDKN